MKLHIKIILFLLFALLLFFLVSPEHKFWQKYFKTPVSQDPQDKEKILMNPNDIADLTLNFILDNQKYSFNKGEISLNGQKINNPNERQKARSFVFFYQMTLEDPLFTAPYFDLEGFKKTIEILKYAQDQYNAAIGKNEQFFPLSFLQKIPDVYPAENEFLTNPTDKTAQNLLSVYNLTAEAYKNEAGQFVNTIKTNEEKIPGTNYVAINSTTTKKVIFSDLEKLIQNSDFLILEVKNRQNCLEKALNCKRPFSLIQQPQTTRLISEDYEKPLPLPSLFPGLPAKRYSNLKGPYAVPTSCFGWGENFTKKTHLFYFLTSQFEIIERQDLGTISNFRIKLANNNFYRKVAKESFEADFQTDLEYTNQKEDNLYVCRDSTYQAQATTLNFFRENIKTKLFEKFDLSKVPKDQEQFFQNARIFEQEFFSTQPPSWKNLEILSSYYAYAAKIMTDESLTSQKAEFINRYLLINRQEGDFAKLTNHSIKGFLLLSAREKNRPGTTTNNAFFYSQVYLSRSLWNVLFFPFSPSFWRNPENLEYLEKREVISVGPNGPYLDTKLATEKFSPEIIERMHFETWEYNKSLLEEEP